MAATHALMPQASSRKLSQHRSQVRPKGAAGTLKMPPLGPRGEPRLVMCRYNIQLHPYSERHTADPRARRSVGLQAAKKLQQPTAL